MSVKLIIKDEVNIKFEGLSLEGRKKLTSTFKYEDPTARYRPAVKLGRWDGKVSLFGLGGNGYLSQLERCLTVLESMDIEVDELEDLRTTGKIEFALITDRYWADQGKVWPKGHRFAGQEIVLRADQVEVVNRFFENPQSLQEVATGAGKTIMTATLAHCCEVFGRTIVIVPNKDLVTQTEEDFVNVGLDVGVYYGDRKDLNKTHTICTWQSLNILDKKSKNWNVDIAMTLAEFLDGVRTVIVDECFDGGTLIETTNGKIPIKYLKAGDKIINLNEELLIYKEDTIVKVHKNLMNGLSEQMLELEFDNGSTIRCTANHKFLTTAGWVRADELTNDLEIIDINTYN
jgi:hypothetical protein